MSIKAWASGSVVTPGKCFTEEYISLNAKLHIQNRRFGYNAAKRKSIVKDLVGRYDAASVLDYGSGKGSLKEVMGEIVKNYDPAIPEFSRLPEPADLVVCLDVMEHIEPPFVDNVLDHIKALTLKAAYFIIVFHESKDILPDGRNAHVCIEGKRFWDEKLKERFKIVERFISEKQEGFYEVVPWRS
jgi:hypothetical protein